MKAQVTITLDFDTYIPTKADVYNYLNELMDSKCLHFEVETFGDNDEDQ